MNDLLKETTCLKEGEIKRYLSDQSSKKEILRVENHILDCPFCSDAIDGIEGYYSFETDNDLEILNNRINHSDDEPSSSEDKKVIHLKNKQKLFSLNRVAAAILLFILPVSGWLYINSNSSFPTDYADSITMRSTDSDESKGSALMNVISLYEADKYEAALASAQNILSVNKEDVKTTYYAGLSALKIEEFQLAADYFMVVRLNSDFYYEDATWMEAQALVGLKDFERAKSILDGITNKGEGPFYEKAMELKNTLK